MIRGRGLSVNARGLAIALLALACARSSDSADSATGRSSDSAATTPAGAGQTSATGMRTDAMPAPWSTITYKEFDDYIKSLDFEKGGGKHDHERNCTPSADPECSGANHKTKVDLDPEENVVALDPAALDPNGHVIARFINKGKAMEEKYKIPPGETVYWLITAGKSEFVYFDKGKVKQIASTFPYTQCHPADEQENSGREADFSWCRKKSGSIPVVKDDGDDPAWISCLAGCCIAEDAT